MKPIIKVENISKRYNLGPAPATDGTLQELLAGWLRAPFHRGSTGEQFWALRDVSLDVYPGEVVGIIGRNGAGKSTLLKILSRITEPTTGRVELFGHVGSLLEVGTGFHPELTGRENIYLNGAILGMRHREVARRFDEIVAFAEVERFLDTPVKRFSSGMYVRLAFAVAAHLEPEILIVDEVLAVGDAAFQKKCLGKMGQVAGEGRTVLFVSHDMRSIKSLCRFAIHLESGRVVTKAPVREAIDSYTATISHPTRSFPVRASDIVVHDFRVYQGDAATEHVDGSRPFEIRMDFALARDLSLFRVGIYLKSAAGETVLRSFVADWDPERENVRAGIYRARLDLPAKLLMGGNYLISLHASRYGIVDYFPGPAIQELISVAAPVDYNSAHLSEVADSTIMLPNEWEIVERPCNP